jgi:GNAT superfamily N-acetyltransferase
MVSAAPRRRRIPTGSAQFRGRFGGLFEGALSGPEAFVTILPMTVEAPTTTIRAANPVDHETCLTLDHSCSTDYVWQMGLSEQGGTFEVVFRPARLPRSTKVLYPRGGEALLQSWRAHDCFLVAELDGLIVGYANTREEPAQEAGWVADLVVDRAHRLCGVGTALLRAVRHWALENKLRHLIVETQTKNYPAIQFLQKRGLVFCGYNDLYYPNQDIAIFFGQTLR